MVDDEFDERRIHSAKNFAVGAGETCPNFAIEFCQNEKDAQKQLAENCEVEGNDLDGNLSGNCQLAESSA
ncbi:MAG: hypothetical protein NZ805_05750 [Armatimonadetes bacterium]|nr:hypothetical protein [Armatimonadota bacterium]MDW8028067.1 hypothetical protein [Armatimonadota bacterium]